MTCYYPKRLFIKGVNSDGKKVTQITSFNVSSVRGLDGELVYDSYQIPCGRCFGCRLDNSRQWAMRCALEASYYDFNYFLTITYDEDHVDLSLHKQDFQRFISSVRKSLERDGKQSFRYFGCGEYGGNTLRPHYHLCCFGLEIPDLKFYKRTSTGVLYNSAWLDSIWKKGYIVISEFNYKTAGYVARYTMKKAGSEFFEYSGAEKEFVFMSRRPGLGYQFFMDNYESVYETDKLYFSFGGKSGNAPPRYFDYLFKKIDENRLDDLKINRKLKADLRSFNEFLKTSLVDEYEYINSKEIPAKLKFGVRRNAI